MSTLRKYLTSKKVVFFATAIITVATAGCTSSQQDESVEPDGSFPGFSGWVPSGARNVGSYDYNIIPQPDSFHTFHSGTNNSDNVWVAVAPKHELDWVAETAFFIPEGPTYDNEGNLYLGGEKISFSPVIAEYYPQTAAALDAGDYPGAGSAFIGETLYKIEPDADTNGDGLVSQEEHEAYQSVMVDQFLVQYGDYNEDGTVDQKDVEDWMSDNDLGGDEDEGAFDSFRAVFGAGEADASRDMIAFTAGNGQIDASNALVRGDALGAARDVAQLYLDLISLTVGEGGGRGAVLTAPAEAFLSATEGE